VATEINASQVKALRDRTGLGFMQCKKALQEALLEVAKPVNDQILLNKAEDILRQNGLKFADRKADRLTSQGRIGAAVDPKDARGVLVELDCESDFVARNEDFGALLDEICRHLLAASPLPENPEALLAQPLAGAPGTTVEARVKAGIAKIGENIRLKRFLRYDPPEGSRTGFYVHPPGRIAVLMELSGVPGEKAAVADVLLKDLCMHVAATNPLALAPEEIDPTTLVREEAIYRVQAREKPPQVAEKIVKGKLEAFFSERCLLRQQFVKDNTVHVQAHVQATLPGARVRRFTRYEISA
jgi:elongation factor Ts